MDNEAALTDITYISLGFNLTHSTVVSVPSPFQPVILPLGLHLLSGLPVKQVALRLLISVPSAGLCRLPPGGVTAGP